MGDDCCPSCPPQRDTVRVEDADGRFSTPGCNGPIDGDLVAEDVPQAAGESTQQPLPFLRPRSISSGQGIRICLIFEGPQLSKEPELHAEMALCIAKASTICSSRVRIADTGPPLPALAQRPVVSRQRVAAPERPTDTGAGVLPLLDPESGPETERELTEPELTPEAPRSAQEDADSSNSSQGTRVLIAIREPPSKDGNVEEDEVRALQALEILYAALEDSESQLQKDLQRLSHGCRVKLWGSAAPSARSRLESRYGCRDLRGGRSPKAMGLHSRALWRRPQPVA